MVLASLWLTAACAALAVPVQAQIDGICRRIVVDPRGPGAAVAVISRGRLVHRACYGMADVKRQTPITPTTLFDLASVSKQFTATCIMMLADQGRLAFADDVRRFLPQVRVYDSRRPIRITDLLHMTSGLPEYDDADPTITRAKLLSWLRSEKLAYRTGTRYEYTNTNYVLLGYIVETVSGLRMSEFLSRNVFRRVPMPHSTFFSDAAHPPRRAMGYTVEKGRSTPSRLDVPNTADGNVFSCLDDMIAWERVLRRDGLVRASTLAQARAPGRLDSGSAIDYGFGWEVSSDSATIEHSGAWYGASAYISLDFDSGESIIVLSNVEDLADTIHDAISSR